ncbi:MAG: prepilin-type N-terminal cleavage/methylation domain-containing protein [bacterium]|nr:prepilin-type N-terminal cleavage/methylation domain-containing protein [bacterium]
MTANNKKSGLTLLELLITISLIAILTAMLLPAFSTTLQNSHRASCMNNIHHIVMCLRIDYLDRRTILPGPDYENGKYLPGTPGFWATRLAGYIYDDEEKAYQRCDQYGLDINAFRCPNDSSEMPETVSYSKERYINGKLEKIVYIKTSPIISGNISYNRYNPPMIMGGFVDDLWSLSGCDGQERPLPFCGKSEVRPAKSTNSDHHGEYLAAYITGYVAIYRSKDASIVIDNTEEERQERMKKGTYAFCGRD